jgi:hypothetical protein
MIKKGVKSRRESSWDRTGGNKDFVAVMSGDTAVLCDIHGAGCIKHIWMTTLCQAPQYLRKLVLEMYWDGEENPSVRTPLGDFFGIGHGISKHFISLPISMITVKRNGPNGPYGPALNSFFSMPFGSQAKIQIVNESEEMVEDLFYHIDYELYDEPIPEDMGRFHATWTRENPCTPIPQEVPETDAACDLPGKNLKGEENYVALEAEGTGQYVGLVLNVDNYNVSNQFHPWFVEGDDMIFIDGDEYPTINGTGLEDYFHSAWCFPTGEYAGPYQGTTLAADTQEQYGKWSMYRFHIEEPIYFDQSIKVTFEHGHNNDQANDWSSVAYWYQLEPHKELPELPPVASRLARRHPDFGVWNK